jgi:phosphoenolpyruvate-protein kinase (PTS system EI component)
MAMASRWTLLVYEGLAGSVLLEQGERQMATLVTGESTKANHSFIVSCSIEIDALSLLASYTKFLILQASERSFL